MSSPGREEVERLCHNLLVAHEAGDGDEDLPTAVEMLRALHARAEAGAAALAVCETWFAYEYGDAEHPDIPKLIRLAERMGWQATRPADAAAYDPCCTERDAAVASLTAARAEAARLREALEMISAMYGDDLTHEKFRNAAKHYARSALAGEAGHGRKEGSS